MKIQAISNNTFTSKLPQNIINTKQKRQDAWDYFVKEANKEGLLSEAEACLNKIQNDGEDTLFAMDSYTSDFGVFNLYFGLYDNINLLISDRINGLPHTNTINGKLLWLQKERDNQFKVVKDEYKPDKRNFLGNSFPKAVIEILNRIADKTTPEHKRVYGIDKTKPEQILRKFRAKI